MIPPPHHQCQARTGQSYSVPLRPTQCLRSARAGTNASMARRWRWLFPRAGLAPLPGPSPTRHVQQAQGGPAAAHGPQHGGQVAHVQLVGGVGPGGKGEGQGDGWGGAGEKRWGTSVHGTSAVHQRWLAGTGTQRSPGEPAPLQQPRIRTTWCSLSRAHLHAAHRNEPYLQTCPVSAHRSRTNLWPAFGPSPEPQAPAPALTPTRRSTQAAVTPAAAPAPLLLAPPLLGLAAAPAPRAAPPAAPAAAPAPPGLPPPACPACAPGRSQAAAGPGRRARPNGNAEGGGEGGNREWEEGRLWFSCGDHQAAQEAWGGA